MIRTNGNAIYAALRFLAPTPLQTDDRVGYDFDAAASINSGLPMTDEGIHAAHDLTGTDTLRATPLEDATTERSGTMAGTGDTAIFHCGIANGASGVDAAHSSSIVVPEPGAPAAALAAALALSIAKRRRA